MGANLAGRSSQQRSVRLTPTAAKPVSLMTSNTLPLIGKLSGCHHKQRAAIANLTRNGSRRSETTKAANGKKPKE